MKAVRDRHSAARRIPTSGTQAVRRALRVLGAFGPGQEEQGVSDIAAHCDLPLSTAHRLCRALVEERFLTQRTSNGKYTLGPAALMLGQLAEQTLGLDRARAVLSRWGDLPVAETVKLGVRSGNYATILLRVRNRQYLAFDRPSGSQRFPLHASALGKALLAFAPNWRRGAEALSPLERLTPLTITDPSQLCDELYETRLRGFAVVHEEWKVGLSCVAAPVLDGSRVARAAIAAGLPPGDNRKATAQQYGPVVMRIADVLSQLFSTTTWPSVEAN